MAKPGCSMCLAMNSDKLVKVSVVHRHQIVILRVSGRGGRTHLVSPQMAVAAALSSYLSDVRNI